MNYKLNPSDFAFLYEGCKRCFYLKVTKNIRQPSISIPSIFSKIANLLEDYYNQKHTKELHPDLPSGVVNHAKKYIQSNVIKLPNHNSTCFISGKFDTTIRFDDGTYGIIDFKTGSPKEEHTALYSRQLHAYAYALENPAQESLALFPITKIGLLYIPPFAVKQTGDIRKIAYEAEIHWVEMKKNEQDFLKFIGEVLTLLDSPELPASSPNCMWCKYVGEVG